MLHGWITFEGKRYEWEIIGNLQSPLGDLRTSGERGTDDRSRNL